MSEPTSDDRTYMVILLDRSGSMARIRSDMEPALNQFVDEQKAVPGKCRVTFAQFDDVYEEVHSAVKIDKLPKLELDPRNMTALRDAMGRSMTEARNYVAGLPANKHPKYKLFIVVTDGGENHSRQWTRQQVTELTSKMEAEGWKFTYLGANQDAIAEGGFIGVAAASSMTYAPTHEGIMRSFSSLSHGTAAIRTAKASNYAYSEKDREDAMGGSSSGSKTP